jgi:hypothetical protein
MQPMRPSGGEPRRPRRVTAWIAATLVAAVLPIGPAGAQEAEQASEALETVATCLRGSRHLLVAFVVDESDSLGRTDPDFARVDAALLAFDGLVDITGVDIAGETPTVEAFVGGFARDFTVVADWGDLARPNQRQRVRDAIASFRERRLGIDTDIPTALASARRAIAERAEAVATDPCKVILFFTDGDYALSGGDFWGESEPREYAPDLDLTDPANTALALERGEEYVCDPRGVADDMRNDGIVLLNVALVLEIGGAGQHLLERIATGESSDGLTCGTDASPEYGSYTAVDDVRQLVATFDDLVSRVAGGSVVTGDTGTICVGAPCPEGATLLRLEPPLSRVRILVDTGDPQVGVEIAAPGGASQRLTSAAGNGSAELAGAAVTWTWPGDQQVQVEIALPAGAADEWTGEWTHTLVADQEVPGASPGEPQASYFTPWLPSIAGDTELVRGQEGEVAVDIVDGDGELVDPESIPGTVTVTATATDPISGERFETVVQRDGAGRYRVRTTPGGESSTVDIAVTLTIETTGGIELNPATEQSVSVRAPSLFPALRPSELRLDSVRGTGRTSATIEIAAGADSDACVWFAPEPDVTAVPVGTVSATFEPAALDRESCITVSAGETASVRVTFANTESGEGVVRGTILATLSAAAAEGTEPLAVPFSFDLAPPINEAERVGLFLAILLPGVLAPILVLALVNRRQARFRATSGVRAARVTLLVERTVTRLLRVFAQGDETGVTMWRLRPGAVDTNLLDAEDFEPLDVAAGHTVRVHGLEFQAHAPRNPFGDATATVEGLRGEVLRARVAGDPWASEDQLPLALPGVWVVVAPGHGGALEVTPAELGVDLPGGDERTWICVDLVAFVATGAGARDLAALVADLGERLGAAANAVADEVDGLDPTAAR